MILICSDSFKDGASAPRVCAAIKRGLTTAGVSGQIVEFPLSDGGDGLDNVLDYHLDLDRIDVKAVDPIRRPITTQILHIRDKDSAYFTMAQSAGLELLSGTERNPLKTSTHGVGYMLQACRELGIGNVYVGLGGSATHDIGSGMAQHLGWKFLDKSRDELKMCGEALAHVAHLSPPTPAHENRTQVHFLTDVDNNLLGKQGAAMTYAPQKGASPEMCDILEAGSQNFNELVKLHTGIDMSSILGGGAAGGLGAGGVVFANAKLTKGIDAVCELTEFDKVLDRARIVITGEGKLDKQTARGKLISGVTHRARLRNLPVVVFCGQCALSQTELSAVGIALAVEISKGAESLEYSINHTEELLESWAMKMSSEILNLAKD